MIREDLTRLIETGRRFRTRQDALRVRAANARNRARAYEKSAGTTLSMSIAHRDLKLAAKAHVWAARYEWARGLLFVLDVTPDGPAKIEFARRLRRRP